MPKFLCKKVIGAKHYTHSQNFDCHDFFSFRSLKCSFIDISKFPWQKKRQKKKKQTNKQTKGKYLTILKGPSKDNDKEHWQFLSFVLSCAQLFEG